MHNVINRQLQKIKFENFNIPQFIRLINYLEYETKNPIKFNFSSAVDFNFPETEIRAIDFTYSPNIEIEAIANFLGIIGPTGILPSCYTEIIIEAKKVKDKELLDFIDIFYDKIIKLFIKITTKYDIHLGYESYILGNKGSRKHNLLPLTYLIGVSKNIAVNTIPEFLTNYVGLLLSGSRSTYNLKVILSSYLNTQVEIKQFILERLRLAVSECSKLAQTNNQLGVNLYLGTQAYFYQNKIKIIIGPMNLSLYTQLLIGTETRIKLEQILDFYLGHEIKYRPVLLLVEKEKPTILSFRNRKMLGRNIWLKTVC